MASNPTDRSGHPVPPLAVPVKQAAALLGISPRKLWTLSNTGEIPAVRFGRCVRFRPEDLEAFLATHIAKRQGGGK